MKYKILEGNVVDRLKDLEDESVNCCVTSPPYWNLRDYGNENQIGLEDTPDEFIEKLVKVFSEVRRVLKNDGTLWVNIGDSYAANRSQQVSPSKWSALDFGSSNATKVPEGLKPKDLVGIPWMLAFALRRNGWYLRQDIIWHKPNTMPESVKDRCTKAHEYIFLLAKSEKYYYDSSSIAEPTVTNSLSIRDRDVSKLNNTPGRTRMGGLKTNNYETRNKRSVWSIATQSYREAHFATFPEKLVESCILAGCPENGLVLDPFSGSGTTGVVSIRNNRNYVGIELNPTYVELSHQRIEKSCGFLAEREDQ